MDRSFFKNYQALVIGALINIGLIVLLIRSGTSYFIVNPVYVSPPIYIFINGISFGVCWFFTAFLVNKFPVYQVLGVVGLLVASSVAQHYMESFNPITIPLVIVFFLGLTRLSLPQFFQKYKIAILSVYGLVLTYFFIFRTMPNYLEDYHKSFINFMLIPIPVFSGLWVYEQWRWMRILKADKAKAELMLLKSQVNPHFFFNTLNNLYGLVVEKSDKAPEVVLKLSDMMRYTIYEGKEDVVLLKDEISYLENYIELHKIRYQKKVDIVFIHEVEGGLKVAPLLFIILLENAFKHGVEKMRGNAFICLRMQTHGNQLFFTIANSMDESTPTHQPGIGLENLKKRLEHLYHNRYKLTIEKETAVYRVHLNLELT